MSWDRFNRCENVTIQQTTEFQTPDSSGGGGGVGRLKLSFSVLGLKYSGISLHLLWVELKTNPPRFCFVGWVVLFKPSLELTLHFFPELVNCWWEVGWAELELRLTLFSLLGLFELLGWFFLLFPIWLNLAVKFSFGNTCKKMCQTIDWLYKTV